MPVKLPTAYRAGKPYLVTLNAELAAPFASYPAPTGIVSGGPGARAGVYRPEYGPSYRPCGITVTPPETLERLGTQGNP